MSRHYFNTVHNGLPVIVYLGWDRPMQYFFLVIEKPAEPVDDTMQDEDEDEDSGYLYTNLYESDPFGLGLGFYRDVLQRFEIVVPESMFIEVQRDAERNVGNRIVTHQADGSFTEQAL
ncbi:hypothetical protein [Pseudomonas aeruginosa]|uniref:hypothetical protein n=1 Tax=Pseudomonas aeruginosa TaxID=287 RepID=UPI000F7E7041|nr:hypothetical protein [Pseudomonas aeruginosa]RTB44102.1 hypothetical protein EJ655_08160 [Pseudomonas aeruginosa]